MTETCPRCAAAMEWRHGSWQCAKCRYKAGCCEGPTGECYSDASELRAESASARSSRSR